MTAALGRWRATYTPGEWVVLSGPTSLVVLEPPNHDWASLINTLWDQVVASSSITDLASLLATFKIDELPSFGAFFWTDEGMRSLVRGQISVIDLATGKVVADGQGIQTWSEVGLNGVEHVRVDLPHEGDATLLELPLVVGAVRASSVSLDASDSAQVSSPQGEPTPAELLVDKSELTTEPLPAPAAESPGVRTVELSVDEIAAIASVETELMASPFDEPGSDTKPDVAASDLAESEVGDPDLAEPEGGETDRAESEVGEPDLAEPDVADSDLAPSDVAAPQKLEDAVALNLTEDSVAELFVPATPSPDTSAGSAELAILAVLCPNGHASEPNATSCRVCGSPVGTQGPQLVGPPVLAVLRASNGTSAEVDRPILIGRAPSSDRSSSRTPRLMTVPSPNHDISRTHLEIAPDEWQVVVTDLNSTNGTILVPPGAGDGQQLAPGERIPVQMGTVLELGDGVSVLIDFPQ